jgi:hypothetical protein
MEVGRGFSPAPSINEGPTVTVNYPYSTIPRWCQSFRAFYHAVRGRHNFRRINSSLHPPSSNRFSAQVVRCYRLPDKLLRGMVTDHYCSGVPASAIPYNCLVRVSTEWIDSFQVVYMSAYRAGKGWCHGVTSLAFLDVGDCLPAPSPGTPIRRARGILCSIPDQEKRKGAVEKSRHAPGAFSGRWG